MRGYYDEALMFPGAVISGSESVSLMLDGGPFPYTISCGQIMMLPGGCLTTTYVTQADRFILSGIWTPLILRFTRNGDTVAQ